VSYKPETPFRRDEEETEMKSTAVETFLLGVTFGIGITILALYIQKSGRLVTSIAEMERIRRTKEEKKLKREALKAVGFSDEEIDEVFK
jgi:hypothetical protein